MILRSFLLSLLGSVPLLGQGPELSQFRQRLPLGMGAARSAAMADLNGDGLLDLCRLGDGVLQVLVQDRSGRFRSWLTTPLRPSLGQGRAPAVEVVTGHFLGGRSTPDVLVVFGDGNLWVYPNTGKTLTPPVTGNAARLFGSVISQVLVGNVWTSSTTDELIMLSAGNPPLVFANFAARLPARAALPFPSLPSPRGVLADFDRDGDDDLVILSGDPKQPRELSAYQSQVLMPANVEVLSLVNPSPFPRNFRRATTAVAVGDIANQRRPQLLLIPSRGAASTLEILETYGATRPFAFRPLALPGKFVADQPWHLQVADVCGDGHPDLVVLEGDGSLVWSQNTGASAPGRMLPAVEMLPRGGRLGICIGDLEGDRDLDVFVPGWGTEDALLLNTGVLHKPAFVDVESQDLQARPGDELLLAVLDVNGDRDLDLLRFNAQGQPSVLINQRGQARFEELSRQTLVAPLPNGVYTGLVVGSLASTGGGDLLVLGHRSGSNPTGVRVLGNAGAGLIDQTSQTWHVSGYLPAEVALGDVLGAVRGSAGAMGYDDVFAIDAAGDIALITNAQGNLSRRRQLSLVPAEAGSRLFIARADLDPYPDLWVLQPTQGLRIFFQDGSGQRPDTFTERSYPAVVGTAGLVAELTGDPWSDILVADDKAPGNLRLWSMSPTGVLSDVSRRHLAPPTGPALTEVPQAIALIRDPGQATRSIVLGFAKRGDLIMVGSAASSPYTYAAAKSLPGRGSSRTEAFWVADLDVDGDMDLVSQRYGDLPAIHYGARMQLAAVGVAQVGRQALLRIRIANRQDLHGIGIGVANSRTDLGHLGIARLSTITQHFFAGTASPGRDQEFRIAVPKTMQLMSVPMQLVRVPAKGDLEFGNLELLRISRH